jgi:hypothetical protein
MWKYHNEIPLYNNNVISKTQGPGIVGPSYNLSYSVSGDVGDHESRPTPGNIFETLSQNKPSMVSCTYNASCLGGGGKSFIVQGWPRQKHETLFRKHTKSKRTHGSRSRVPA